MSRQIAALVRHGEFQRRANVPSARQPWPLTRRGQHQAHAAGADLAAMMSRQEWSLHPDLYCAPQLRSWETAVLVADAFAETSGHRPEIVETDALAERSLGAAANLTVAEIDAMLAADARQQAPPAGWRTDPFYRLPVQGAESLMTAGRRVAGHLHAMVTPGAESDEPPVLHVVVGHGAAFRHAAHILGVLSFEDLSDLRLPHARPVLLERGPQGDWQQIDGTWRDRGSTTFRTRRRRRRTATQ